MENLVQHSRRRPTATMDEQGCSYGQMAGQHSGLEGHGFPTINSVVDQRNTQPGHDTSIQCRDDLELDLMSGRHRQNNGTTRSLSRARWSHQMKKYLIELLKDYNVPGYRTQNAWSKGAWIGIVSRMNEKFRLTLTLAQVKQKEQDLKKDFRSVKDLVSESGFGWDPNAMMVVAPDSIWETFCERTNKDALNWRDKSFPYYDDLFALYEGRYADGKNRHGMDHYANKARNSSHVPSAYSPLEGADVQIRSPSPTLHGVDDPYIALEEEREIDTADFSQQQYTTNPPMRSTCTPSKVVTTPEMHDSRRTKRKKNGDFQDRYLKLKKEEIDRFAAIEEKKLEDPYTIPNCIKTLEGLQGLSMSDLLKAADIFKNKQEASFVVEHHGPR